MVVNGSFDEIEAVVSHQQWDHLLEGRDVSIRQLKAEAEEATDIGVLGEVALPGRTGVGWKIEGIEVLVLLSIVQKLPPLAELRHGAIAIVIVGGGIVAIAVFEIANEVSVIRGAVALGCGLLDVVVGSRGVGEFAFIAEFAAAASLEVAAYASRFAAAVSASRRVALAIGKSSRTLRRTYRSRRSMVASSADAIKMLLSAVGEMESRRDGKEGGQVD